MDSVHSMADVAAIEGASQRLETPCGDGVIVWHSWGEGRPLLLLHGGSGSWTHWVRNINALCVAGYRLLVPDLPGFGDSSLPPDGRDADVMPAWLDAGLVQILGAQACPIVGFSFGAMVGTLLAAEYPTRASGLILVGAPALSEAPMPSVGLRTWEHLPTAEARRDVHRHNLGALMMASPESIDDLALNLHAANLERDRLKKRRLARTDIVVRTLPQVQCSVSGIWGDQDAVYKGRLQTIEPALRMAPRFQSLVLLPGTGHWAPYESATAFNDAVLRLLERHDEL